ncbi:MAG: hypothetical protein KAT17_09875 [Candidatus Aminicenantes bacterium]|nr:hypothetical protein [Candidatus Aminicenantes bacterium]
MILLDLGYFFFLLISFPIWIKFIFNKNYRHLLRQRISPGLTPNKQKHIWIHAVSVGEVKSLKNLIRQLTSRNHPIVLSVTTPSGYEYAKTTHPDIRVINSPLDFSFVVKRFLKTINPSILVLNELEIWPNWLSWTKKSNIPILLINGRISDIAFKKYRKFRLLIKKIFNKIDFYILQSEIHKKRFSFFNIPESKIEVCGNIKADEASALLPTLPSENQIMKYLKTAKPRKKIIGFASTHPSDEKIIIPALEALKKRFALVMVPRHPDRIQKLRQQLEQQGIPYSVWSDSNTIDLDKCLLIFDRIGYLFNILAISDIVYMGGTFEKKIGGHNLYEPAVQGKIIIGGPHYNNFPIIGHELIKTGVYRLIKDGNDFIRSLNQLEAIDLEKIKTRATQTVMDKKGSTECILKHIRNLIGD